MRNHVIPRHARRLAVRAVMLAGVGVFVFSVAWMYYTTATGLVEDRSMEWWLQTDYCPQSDTVCGGPARLGLAIPLYATPLGLSVYYVGRWIWGGFSD